MHKPFYYTDDNGAMTGYNDLEFILKVAFESALIPGVTCSVDTLSKSISKNYIDVSAGKAEITKLFADTTLDGKGKTEDYTVIIDDKVTGRVAGKYLPHFTDMRYDTALMADLKNQLSIALSDVFIKLLIDNAPIFETKVLTKENIVDAIIDLKKTFKRITKKNAVTLMASTETLGLIEKTTFFTPNANFTGIDSDVVGRIKGMHVVERAELDDEDVNMIALDPTYIKGLFIDPQATSVTGMTEQIDNGFIIRATKPETNITSSTSMHLPFGFGIVKLDDLLMHKKV